MSVLGQRQEGTSSTINKWVTCPSPACVHDKWMVPKFAGWYADIDTITMKPLTDFTEGKVYISSDQKYSYHYKVLNIFPSDCPMSINDFTFPEVCEFKPQIMFNVGLLANSQKMLRVRFLYEP